MNTRKQGAQKEEQVCACLLSRGIRICERNFRCRQGEVDVVGEDEGYLVFVEVKYRASGVSGSPAEAVTAAKQGKICRVADYYRYRHGIGDDRAVRYDVVTVEGDGRTVWYKNAFFHIYAGRR